MQIAFIGCGYVADFYAITLGNYPELELKGVLDINQERARNFSQRYAAPTYNSLEELLADPEIELVVNLTNPKDHYAITEACLHAGKHVFSEKPLAMSLAEGQALVDLARERKLLLASAPSTLLSATAQTVWRLLREGAIGQVWLVYAELDEGTTHQMNYLNWLNQSGVPWPFEDEFETGCTIEHAAYYLTWLTAFFGPARELTAYATCLVPDKLGEAHVGRLGDDFSVACIKFASGVVGRLTCSTIAPEDHSLTIVGSEGVIKIDDSWQFESPVVIQKRAKTFSRRENHFYLTEPRVVPLDRPEQPRVSYNDTHDMNFASGIADLAEAIKQGRPPRLSAEHGLHVLEIILKMLQPQTQVYPQIIETSFPEIAPMPWVKMGGYYE
jgi:predicted dehydrogenase